MKTLTALIQDFQDTFYTVCVQELASCHSISCVLMAVGILAVGFILVRVTRKRGKKK